MNSTESEKAKEARLQFEEKFGIPMPDKIHVHVTKIWKADENITDLITKYNDTIQIEIANRQFIIGERYLLSGIFIEERGTFLINECSWCQKWMTLSHVQHWGVIKYYQKFCECQVRPCFFGEDCLMDTFVGCTWNLLEREVGFQKGDCSSKKGICIYNKVKTSCKWHILKLREKCQLQQIP